jgi:hypothetical protein
MGRKNQKSKDKKPGNQIAITQVIDRFMRSIEGLSASLPIVISTMGLECEKHGKVLNDFFKKYAEKNETDGEKKYVLKLNTTNYQRFKTISTDLHRLILSLDIIPKNYIVSLISIYDAFLGDLIRCLYRLKPDILNASEKNISYTRLIEFKNIEDAKQYIIEKEVEELLRKSHVEQFDWLQNKFDIKLKEGLSIWPTFVELTQRRNLFAHCDGIVSQQYLDVCKVNRVKLDKCRPGNRLSVSPTYFDEAFRCLFEVGVKLSHVLWRKLRPDQIEEADKHLGSDIIYHLLCLEQYDLAKISSDFAINVLKKYSDDSRRRIYIINAAIAYKFSGDNLVAKQILDKEDWSASDNVFKLCVAILKDEFKIAPDLMKKIGTNNVWLDKQSYVDWPVFKEFRSSGYFLKAYKEVFGEDFENREDISEIIEKRD